MLDRTLAASLVTQSREAVKQLITFHNHGVKPQEMPDFHRLTGEMVLVLNNKKDAYYVTKPKTCSCPSAAYRPGQLCKHARKYFPESMREKATVESNRPNTKAFRPFDSLPSEEKAAAGMA